MHSGTSKLLIKVKSELGFPDQYAFLDVMSPKSTAIPPLVKSQNTVERISILFRDF